MTTYTDEQVYDQISAMVAQDGAKWAEQYELFLDDNRTFDPYWAEGVEAIAHNTVESLSFGRELMIQVGRKHLKAGTFRDLYVLGDLAIAMNRAAEALLNAQVRHKPAAT